MTDVLLNLDLEIDRVVHQFEQALRHGEGVRIEDVVDRQPMLGTKLVHELLLTEMEFRRSHQLPVDWDDYAARFPEAVTRLRKEQPSAVSETSRNSLYDSAVLAPTQPVLAAVEEPPLTPLDLSDYVLETKLGGGGQGDVFLARQRSLSRRVAVKLLKQTSTGDSHSEQRFLREARTLAQTSHPQIVTIHGIGRAPGSELFLVMEYIDGKDLAKQIADAPFEFRVAVEIAVQIARAVEHAHSRGVIHRDLKPSNVLWHEVRGPVVTDFGLAKDLRTADALTLTEQMMGTPTYMAPEQAHRRFGEISERTDVYGLAGTLYALLTGRSPIPTGPVAEVLQQLTSDEPIDDPRQWRPELPAALCDVCLKGLAKHPGERYQSIQEFSRDLEHWLMQEDTEGAALPSRVVVAPPSAAMNRLEPGGRFGRFKLIASASNDPMRKIFRAEDETGRQVWLKCLPPEWLPDRMKRSQFRQEVLLSCSLSHPCLAKVVEAGTLHDTEFLALEFLDGESLSQVLAREGRLSEQRAAEILQPIADAMHLIHAAGVIYRDLRPQNIMLVADGRPMLADVRFSEELALNDNVTMSGRGVVTAKYVAPELLLGKKSDVASDVYTLGATLFSLVTGQEPFSGEHDHIKLLIAKNATRFTPPKSLAPDLSQAMCELIASTLEANSSRRPSSAQEFANRLSACIRHAPRSSHGGLPPDSDNLLHAVWDQLDPELQDAFSLAYNKKRRTGSTRISTRDLFEAMARLGTGPLKQVFNELPHGSLPEPTDPGVPIDRVVLHEQPLLSDCVRESLAEFRKLAPGRQKVSPVDLFVDVAKHGHGPSVVKLRELGVDPEAMERIVQQLGLRVIRRETISPTDRSDEESPLDVYLCDDNVQFSVYRPKAIPPETWQPLLAFAHVSELPADAPAEAPDPVAEVRRQAEQILGTKLPAFQSLTSDSSQSIPRSGELLFVPSGEGLIFNPPQRSFLWQEPVHREEFRFKAAAHLDGKLARGRLSVYLGRLLIAEVGIVTRVDCSVVVEESPSLNSENRAYRFRRIYACVSRADRAVVSELQHYAELLRDAFLTSQFERDPSPADLLQQRKRISSADVFQLYWSRNALQSADVEQEWRYALSLRRTDYIRSLYWEEPFPTDPSRSLPPPELLALGFEKIPVPHAPRASSDGARARKSAPKKVHAKLDRVRKPRVHIPYDPREPYLELLNGSNFGKILRLQKDRVTIGRKTDADLTLESEMVHRYHAQVVRDQNAWWVEDLQSRNGTFVNGVRAHGRVQLHDGDRIHIGDFLIGFREFVPADASPKRTLPVDDDDDSTAEGRFEMQLESAMPQPVGPAMNPPRGPQPGDVIGRYQLDKQIASGGKGAVYKAHALADAGDADAVLNNQSQHAIVLPTPEQLDVLLTGSELTSSHTLTPDQGAMFDERLSSAEKASATGAIAGATSAPRSAQHDGFAARRPRRNSQRLTPWLLGFGVAIALAICWWLLAT